MMTRDDLVVIGAKVRLAELETEIGELRQLMAPMANGKAPAPPVARKKRTMSRKARLAISQAQKARWAKSKAKPKK